MPTKLASTRSNYVRQLEYISQKQAREPQPVEIRAPWMGYVPDIEGGILDFSACTGASRGLVNSGEHLVPDVGFCRVDSANLPLGDDGDAAGTAKLTASAVGDIQQPIQHLAFFNREPDANPELVAITRDLGGATENSHVFRLPPGGAWANVPPRGGYAALALPGGTAPLTLLTDFYPDTAVFAGGVPAGSPYAAPFVVGGSAAILQPVQLIVSPTNPVAMWPSYNTAGPPAIVANNYDYPIARVGTTTAFTAKSVSEFFGRACYLNVSYTAPAPGGDYPQRMYHSVVGDPTNIDQTFVGAGFVDAIEFTGPGVALRQLGNVLVGYFQPGIAFYDRTFLPLAPFTIRYVSRQLSLLGTHAVCAIETDTHFGLFDQGWFFLKEDGSTQEAGIANLNTARVRKWTQTWFNLLNYEQRHRINVSYDPNNRRIRIAFPSVGATSTECHQVWVYDLEGDRVWPMDPYGNPSPTPVSQVLAKQYDSSAVTWATVDPTLTWTNITGTWNDYASRLGTYTVYHGDNIGRVYVRDLTKNGFREISTGFLNPPVCIYESVLVPAGGPALWKEADRLDVEYTDQGGAPITLTILTEQGSVSGSRAVDSGMSGTRGVAYLTASNLGGTHHGFKVAGIGPMKLNGFRYVYVPEEGEIQR